jgi:hypothetical protein
MAADRKFTISGPGASDFLTSPSGEDLPGSSGSKGMGRTRGESGLTDPRNLEPGLTPEKDALPPERSAGVPANAAADRRTGSQTGTVGGGGADAHNPAPVRATGADDPTVEEAEKPSQKKRTTKKY